ncbi:MAG: molybdopterin converting factor subunit 1 [Chloroflexota bacterium]|nr:MAG: molybdopterin converting factor subunit 1 [Chloroflexota bacterium]
MRLNVLLFATLKERAGAGRIALELPAGEITVAQLRDVLVQQYPSLGPSMPTAICAINHEFAGAQDVVSEGDEVAFFPPVSGGGL